MTPMKPSDDEGAAELVRRLVSRELPPGAPFPRDDDDLVKSGAIDSMGWVGILSGIEEATDIQDFGASWPQGRAQSVRMLVETLREAFAKDQKPAPKAVGQEAAGHSLPPSLTGWGYALGSRCIEAAEVEAELGLPVGTLGDRAGIRSVARAAKADTEGTLGLSAAVEALEKAKIEPEAVDVLVATSATFLGFPSLSAVLHTRLLLRETCGALDVGGACVGLINALATAQGLLATGRCRTALLVASEVNSRRLARPEVPGEFRGLFGDGACAFVLSNSGDAEGKGCRLGEFISGCAGAFAATLRLALGEKGELEVDFKGEPLANAAISTLHQTIERLGDLSGIPPSEVDWFALHEPNPRLVEIFAQRVNIPLTKIARTAETSGNLGSVTCGVNLCTALTQLNKNPSRAQRGTIYLAAVGPGLLWGGTYLSRPGSDA